MNRNHANGFRSGLADSFQGSSTHQVRDAPQEVRPVPEAPVDNEEGGALSASIEGSAKASGTPSPTTASRSRVLYWSTRALSRLQSSYQQVTTICCILDSFDAAKHSWPRSRKMDSKEFASFNRPRLSSTSLIIHAHHVTTCLSHHVTSTNSSRT